MDHYSILDHTPPPPPSGPAVEPAIKPATKNVPRENAPRTNVSTLSSISAQIAESNRHLPPLSEPGPRFPAEDSGRSLAEMAERDLDAALQLLADRAQYITGASGAAIALRRGEHHDMLCRASSGSNAPGLGALLSMDYGLSGECVRTRQLLRCDDAERDSRVNHEVCRELGIASVVVMPILSGQQILGVFELLSGQPRAFEERDLSALLRLSEMVETAVRHAVAAQTSPIAEPSIPEIQPELANHAEVLQSESITGEKTSAPVNPAPEVAPVQIAPVQVAPVKPEESASRKPLFWSAAMRAQTNPPPESAEAISVPPVLRNLQKCQACGFPVSQGRAFCVECEERQWRGQRLPHPATTAQKDVTSPTPTDSRKFTGLADALRTLKDSSEPQVPTKIAEVKVAEPKTSEPRSSESTSSESTSSEPKTAAPEAQLLAATLPTSASASTINPEQNSIVIATELAEVNAAENSAPFLSSALPSESWLSSNKYILAALLLVAIVIAAIALRH